MRKILLVFSLLVITISSVFAAQPPRQIEIMLQDSASGLAALTQLNFTAGNSPLFFSSEDHAFILQSPDSFPQMYSFTQDNVACSLNAYGPFDQTSIVRLGFAIPDSGTFTFSLQQFTNFDPASMLFLEDRQLNTFTDLRRGPYKVALSQIGEINSRFFLHITFPPSLTSSPAGCLNNDGIIMVNEDSSILWSTCKVIDSVNNVIAIDTNVTGNFSFTGLPGGNYRVEFDYSFYSPQQSVFVDEHRLVSGLNVSNNHDYVLENIQFYTAASNATQINWDFGDGSTITGVANPTYFYIYPGVYTAKVNCSNNYGCAVESDTIMYIDYATSVNNIDGKTVKVFTDINSIRIELENNGTTDYTYSVYNMDGQLVKSGPLTGSSTLLDMTNESAGMYVVNIRSSSSTLSQKVLITH